MNDVTCLHGEPRGPRGCGLCRTTGPVWAEQAHAVPLPFDEAMIPATVAGHERLMYAARIQALFGLPYARTDATHWTRTNGPLTLSVTAGVSRRIDGTLTPALPYGKTPRMLMMWLTTQAVLNQSPTVDLGESLREFTQAVGMGEQNSKRRKELLDQLRRLVALQYTLVNTTTTHANGHELTVNRPLVDSAEIWFSKGDADGEQALMDSQITLGDKFYAEFVLRHALPVRVDHLRALDVQGAGGMAFDIYLWLAYRTHQLQRPIQVSWDQVDRQFGAGYGRKRDFRAQFRKNLAAVLAIHGGFRVDDNPTGLLLKPSTPPVAARRTRRIHQ